MIFKNRIYFINLFLAGLILGITSCKKYLDEKPIKAQVVPSTVADLQALLDAYRTMNNDFPSLLEASADNYYVTSSEWAAATLDDRNNYIWNNSTYTSNTSNWLSTYGCVYQANMVLEQLPNLKNISSDDYNNIKGQALFFRSYAFYFVAQLWSKPYSSSASTDIGIPLRLTAAVEQKTNRSTVEQTYERILNDLIEATNLLPENVVAPTRPNKAAAFGALSRVYLSIGDYSNAGKYADSCLKRSKGLLNFNTLSTTATAPISRFNVETIFYSLMRRQSILANTVAKIDSTLYKTYDNNDLRKVIFFKANTNGTYGFKGSYDGSSAADNPFNGIAVDEMILTRAECAARAGLKDSALSDLNKLMVNRWKNNGSFVPITASTAQGALNIILSERRKELIFRGLRWPDLRRLNMEGANITLVRNVNGTAYSLTPTDLKWVLLIPTDVITISGMDQNPR